MGETEIDMNLKLKDIIMKHKGQFFTVDFIKKDGSPRTINGSIRMVEGHTGRNPVSHLPEYVTVVLSKTDANGKAQFRNVDTTRITRLAVGGKVYKVVNKQ